MRTSHDVPRLRQAREKNMFEKLFRCCLKVGQNVSLNRRTELWVKHLCKVSAVSIFSRTPPTQRGESFFGHLSRSPAQSTEHWTYDNRVRGAMVGFVPHGRERVGRCSALRPRNCTELKPSGQLCPRNKSHQSTSPHSMEWQRRTMESKFMNKLACRITQLTSSAATMRQSRGTRDNEAWCS